MSPKVSDAHSEARREQILLAAMSCFAAKGFHKTSVKDICAAANLSPGAVYSYFKSKDDIIQALGELGDKMNDNTFSLANSQEYASPQDAYSGALSLFISQYKDPLFQTAARMDALFLSEALGNEQLAQIGTKSYGRILEHIRNIVTASQESGEIDTGLDATAVAQVLFSLVQGLSTQYLMGNCKPVDSDAYLKAVLALINGRFFNTTTKE